MALLRSSPNPVPAAPLLLQSPTLLPPLGQRPCGLLLRGGGRITAAVASDIATGLHGCSGCSSASVASGTSSSSFASGLPVAVLVLGASAGAGAAAAAERLSPTGSRGPCRGRCHRWRGVARRSWLSIPWFGNDDASSNPPGSSRGGSSSSSSSSGGGGSGVASAEAWLREHPVRGDVLIGWLQHPGLAGGDRCDLQVEFSGNKTGVWRSQTLNFRGPVSARSELPLRFILTDEVTMLRGVVQSSEVISGEVTQKGAAGGFFELRALPACFRYWWDAGAGRESPLHELIGTASERPEGEGFEDAPIFVGPTQGKDLSMPSGFFGPGPPPDGGGTGRGPGGGIPPDVKVISGPKALFELLSGATDKRSQEEDEQATKKSDVCLSRIRNFSMTPEDVKSYLDRFVIKQDAAKEALSVAICDHYNRVRQRLAVQEEEEGETRKDEEESGEIADAMPGKSESANSDRNYMKPNVLLLGPTGSGKTYLMKSLADLIGVPFVKADATKFSETGYVGRDAEDVLQDLMTAAEGNASIAQFGIVYVDEIDKICGDDSKGGTFRKGVQNTFLKLMEESDVEVAPKSRSIEKMMRFGPGQDGSVPLNTRYILFVFSGAFSKLNEKLREEKAREAAGFGFAADPAEAKSGGDAELVSFLHEAGTKELVEAGLEPEFVGRIPVRVALSALSEDDLFRILTEAEGGACSQLVGDFHRYGIRLRLEDSALRALAKGAVKEQTGARSLITVLESTLRRFKFRLPSLVPRGCKELVVTDKVVEDPEGELARIVAEYSSQGSGEPRASDDESDMAGGSGVGGGDAGCKSAENQEAAT
mmetsp:Transcript_1658/g.3996  ORF Transcript_1658/g.3996 Transcript_1658/m.3996 type:complete len:820 (+) Transcript_1658:98-2557(+)